MILAAGAHPDDIEFGCFGTLAKLARKERVTLLVYTLGELGGDPETRRKEQIQNANLIGAKVKFMRHADGKLVQDSETVGEMREEITASGATTIYAPHPLDSHQDHATAGHIAMTCRNIVSEVLFYETPSTIRFEPNVFEDVTEHFPTKRKALSTFQSQGDRPYLSLSSLEGLAKYRAWQCYRQDRLFEAFELFRLINDAKAGRGRSSPRK